MQQSLRYVLVPKYLSEIPHPIPQADLPHVNAVKTMTHTHTPGGGVLTTGDIEMRKLLLLSTFVALLATTGLAGAQQDSFFNDHFCSMASGGDTITGLPDCSFNTWDQCIASARGLGRWCTANPWWHGPRQELRTQSTSLRRNHR
jgi:hypothetical protein